MFLIYCIAYRGRIERHNWLENQALSIFFKNYIDPWIDSSTVPKVIDFPRYNMKWSGENVILRGIFHVVSRFPLIVFCSKSNISHARIALFRTDLLDHITFFSQYCYWTCNRCFLPPLREDYSVYTVHFFFLFILRLFYAQFFRILNSVEQRYNK